MAQKLTSVRFVKGYKGYNTGEVAGFVSELAGKLVAAGVAKYANKPGPKPEPEAKAEEPKPEEPKRASRSRRSSRK